MGQYRYVSDTDSRESALEGYEEAEAAYLASLRAQLTHDQLALKAAAVRSAANRWQAAAYRDFFQVRDQKGPTDRDVIELEIDAERTELLFDLWSDVWRAHEDSHP
jgi:hypothetical protein